MRRMRMASTKVRPSIGRSVDYMLTRSGVDWVQENVMGQGKQNNESAVEQAKDEQISVSLISCSVTARL